MIFLIFPEKKQNKKKKKKKQQKNKHFKISSTENFIQSAKR